MILHIVAPAACGGLERVVQMLSTGLVASGQEVHVACVSTDAAMPEPFVAPLIARGVQIHPITVAARGYGHEREAIGGLCRRLRPAAVHTHGYRPDVIDAGVPRRAGIPVVTTAHGFTGGSWRNRVYEYLQRRAFRRFDAVVAVSRPLGERLVRAGMSPQRLHVIPNAWCRSAPALERHAARAALGLAQEGFVVGWVGRLSAEKGPDVLLEALPAISSLPLTVCLIGDGIDRPALVARAAQLRIADRIRWLGAVPNAERVFPAFDVCVLSSRTEGTPVVLFEAMGAGVPVVTTSVGGVPDVVSPAEALLVPSEAPEKLAAAIREIHEYPAAAARRAGAAADRLAREFTVGPWLERYLEIYRLVSHGAIAPVAA